jgi:hypothetical protein
VHGVLSQEQCTLQLLFDTLAEELQARDYTTHGVSCNPLIAPERYFDQGFETFDPPRNAFRKSPEVVPSVVRWIEAHAGVRFFLYLHLVDPHTPHTPDATELARLGLSAPGDFPERGMDPRCSQRSEGRRSWTPCRPRMRGGSRRVRRVRGDGESLGGSAPARAPSSASRSHPRRFHCRPRRAPRHGMLEHGHAYRSSCTCR